MNDPGFSSKRSCPPDVALQIGVAILEELERHDGKLEALDPAAITARFPCWREEVGAQLRELKRSRPLGSTLLLSQAQPSLPERLGRFRIVRRLGSGAAGVVVEAIDTTLGRSRALKILRFGFAVEREARALATLEEHPNITRIYGYEEVDGIAFLVMELVHGVSCDRIVQAARRFKGSLARKRDLSLGHLQQVAAQTVSSEIPEFEGAPSEEDVPNVTWLRGSYFRELAQAMSGAALGIAHAHRQGIVHRDLKPANLLLTACGTVKVTDFSHAKGEHLAKLSRTGFFLGTPLYASPEQLAGRHVGPSSDLWSLGATLYELATLQVPFPGVEPGEVLRRIRMGRLRQPRVWNPHLPADLQRIILRCLEREPTLRYPSAGELSADLDRFAKGEAIQLHSVPRAVRLWHALRRPTRRSLAAVILVAAVALVGGGGIVEGLRTLGKQRMIAVTLSQAQEDVARGLDRREQALLERAVTVLERTLEMEPGSLRIKRALLATRARVALEEGNAEEALYLYLETRRLGPLDPRERLNLSRALVSSGHVTCAVRSYDSLPGALNTAQVRGERHLALAYAKARPLPVVPEMAVRAESLPGLPKGSVLAISNKGGPGAKLFLFRGGLGDLHPVLWPLPRASGQVPQSGLSSIAVSDLDGDGCAEVVALGFSSLYVAEGPFQPDSPPSWQPLPDPTLATLPRRFVKNSQGGILGGRGLAVLAPAKGGQPAQIIVGRFRGLASLLVGSGVDGRLKVMGMRPHVGSCLGGKDPSDVNFLKIIKLAGHPRLLVALGAWKHHCLVLYAFGPGATLKRLASVTLGPVFSTEIFQNAAGQEQFLVPMSSQEIYMASALFGTSTPHGWPWGLYLFRPDLPAGRLVPAAFLKLPALTNAHVKAFLLDDRTHLGRLALLACNASGSLPGLQFRRTVVVALDRQRPRLLLRLPGCVTAVVGRQLIVVGADRKARLVELEP